MAEAEAVLSIPELQEAINAFFLLVMGSMVFMMQTGFAFLCAGLIQHKNVVNILIKNLLDACVGATFYWLIGYAFAYGDDFNGFIGNSKFALEMDPSEYASWFFQFTFCATAATIVSGALAERVNFYAYICYCIALTGFIYPITTHWAWTAEGFLTIWGYVDFAGSGLVHCVGGMAALCGVIVLGPRTGRFEKETTASGRRRVKVNQFPRHSVPFVILGTFILFFGFLAFNGGSQLAVAMPDDANVVLQATINTVIAGASGCIFSLFFSASLTHFHHYSLINAACGCLGGMVAICASANEVESWAAFIIGAVGGIWTLVVSMLMLWFGLDDPVDAVAVHLGAGIWGVIAAGLFRPEVGVFRGGKGDEPGSLGWQIVGLLVIIAWVGGTCFSLFFVLKLVGILRVKPELEEEGLDMAKHGEPAYDMEPSFYQTSSHRNKSNPNFHATAAGANAAATPTHPATPAEGSAV
uniref:Ammonium transporter n=1 Tax=Chromera velia CCMP2878 TaxID=1169474 RepID=A0A0G4HLA4_9ALVE|eukprot:Cvel_7340.t1-p1 / transcript=Cvel_7340.t1 / gene=Cvel_7340 / organism=Chromera_velia_CCMP2878 / gene_product=Putative ammonium transporter 1, putative / transcript_product=Putative ammonium transporter 1, putative / location=Cvel_scaffold380:64400-66737(+) / protein_length=467 / sequence_SO=supercontig / SO=protein_coding / is_pseudo=false